MYSGIAVWTSVNPVLTLSGAHLCLPKFQAGPDCRHWNSRLRLRVSEGVAPADVQEDAFRTHGCRHLSHRQRRMGTGTRNKTLKLHHTGACALALLFRLCLGLVTGARSCGISPDSATSRLFPATQVQSLQSPSMNSQATSLLVLV